MDQKSGVNLFKSVKTERKEKEDTRYTYVFASLAMLTLSIGGFLGMMIWEGTLNRQLTNVKNNIITVEDGINSSDLVALRSSIYELNKKAEIIEPVINSEVDLVDIVEKCRDEVPEDIEIHSVSIDEDRVVTVSGISKDFRTIGKLIQKFSDSPNFKNFDIASIDRVDDESNLIEGVRFSIKFMKAEVSPETKS